jgi:Histidine kinase-, DNA gyrase B-, and HSP90-like ATPase
MRSTYLAWARDELLLVALLSVALLLFVTNPSLRDPYLLPSLRLFFDTAVLLVSVIVSVLAYVRFSLERRRFDLFLLGGFFVTATTTLAFAVGAALDGNPVQPAELWAGIAGKLIAAGRVATRRWAVVYTTALPLVLAAVWGLCRALEAALPALDPARRQPALLAAALALQAVLSLVAVIGFGFRYRAHGQDLDRWLAFGATIWLFAELYGVFTPPLSSDYVSHADVLRLISSGVLLSESGARSARPSSGGRSPRSGHGSRVRSTTGSPSTCSRSRRRRAPAPGSGEGGAAGSPLRGAGPLVRRRVGLLRLRAQPVRRVPRLRRQLDVDLEIDRGVDLGPDEQIEIFRIVQEGLANVRRHAGAHRATVLIGLRDGRRVMRIVDDGRGLGDGEDAERGGQGLRNMRARSAAIGGAFRLLSVPDGGTSLEIVLRP